MEREGEKVKREGNKVYRKREREREKVKREGNKVYRKREREREKFKTMFIYLKDTQLKY